MHIMKHLYVEELLGDVPKLDIFLTPYFDKFLILSTLFEEIKSQCDVIFFCSILSSVRFFKEAT